MDLRPKLPLTVPMDIWQEVASASSVAFADSYLSGAEVVGATLKTKTNIAFDRLGRHQEAFKALADLGLRLLSPNGRVGKPYQRKSMNRAEQIEAKQTADMLVNVLAAPRDHRWPDRMRRPS